MSSCHAIFIMGPAGNGKSSFCAAIQQHCHAMGRGVHVVNLDPAADYTPTNKPSGKEPNVSEHVKADVQPSIDIQDLISLDDVMEELNYGPNGGLIFCLEYLLENMEWLEEQVGAFQEDFLLIDCPGMSYRHVSSDNVDDVSVGMTVP